MDLSRVKRLYCIFPTSYKGEILREGIRPGRISGGEVTRVFLSRPTAEKEMQGRFNKVLLALDATKLSSGGFTQLDFNHLFYRGFIPPKAISVVRTKGRNNGSGLNLLKGKFQI